MMTAHPTLRRARALVAAGEPIPFDLAVDLMGLGYCPTTIEIRPEN